MGEGITRCGRADALHPNLYRASFFKPTMCVSCAHVFGPCLPRVNRVLCVPFVLELAPQLVLSKLHLPLPGVCAFVFVCIFSRYNNMKMYNNLYVFYAYLKLQHLMR